MDITKLIEAKEVRLKNMRDLLSDLKAEFKNAETPGVRQLIHEDITVVLNQIDATESALDNLKARVK